MQQTQHELEPCETCAQTGFLDKVWRGTFTMNPTHLLCHICGGRGWLWTAKRP